MVKGRRKVTTADGGDERAPTRSSCNVGAHVSTAPLAGTAGVNRMRTFAFCLSIGMAPNRRINVHEQER